NSVELLNVSYDPTRELYRDINIHFAKKHLNETGEKVIIRQSHGGSGKQARSIIDGLRADIATLALAHDLDEISRRSGQVEQNWESKFPSNSTPYRSTIILLVRKGNPKNIQGFADLVRDDVSVITANPKTSGGARWSYLAAWSYAIDHYTPGGATLFLKKTPQEQKTITNNAINFIDKVYKNVPVLDAGARGATNTFIQRELGDVLIAWENEAFLATKELAVNNFQIITPQKSILAEPPVAVVSKVTQIKNTTKIANDYLNFLYTKEAQNIIAKNYYRPLYPELVDPKNLEIFKPVTFITVRHIHNSWEELHNFHFADGGVFDKIYLPNSK
ncbi:MAG: sulfate ABC transporter substrate-binding protein, partial [Lentisphaeria bacterium]